MSKFGGGIGAPSKEERLKEAADIHLRLGQIQRYCELMVELGQVRDAFSDPLKPALTLKSMERGRSLMAVCVSVGEGAICGAWRLHEVLEEAHAEVKLLSASHHQTFGFSPDRILNVFPPSADEPTS